MSRRRPLAISFPPSSLTSKIDIDPSTHVYVDLALKRLKAVSRRLSATLTSFQDESRLLERLFYKGKNQHKVSLFWRHIEEIRRLCSCLVVVDLMTVVIRVRHAFYNSTNYENANLLKSSWTHLPNVFTLRSTMDALSRVHPLLMKILDRLLGAYCSFKRAMQTGAFLQLVLSLSALTCRLRALSEILLEIHEELVGTLRDLSSSLDAFHKLNHESKNMPSYPDTVPAMSSVPITVSDTGGYQSVTFTAKSGNSEQRSVEVSESSQSSKVKTLEPKKAMDASAKPKSERRKRRLDEIDAIFHS
ncbi:hypothetical protein AGABI1DRAFT_125181 [Agaricus bisporus var. burnettii JB137-S8]|uniref:Uncharacterized protein n=1 Tax=Agaricus bisporus var. burnettii (strain JB137-S8 / ATCC MYA-4627 / FGSC 10392) TaxID=597362 RepID=K5W7A0_AGABU|nr:uncharacterized protein AGABI1DRAFT_125181 [Agaricus bisporus var. burnettii JB137-S8]EKM82719.1 hypothetical protein AGABI1DRAFT_125181 [Agaricus bisporus var. burnettii JB137-S8]